MTRIAVTGHRDLSDHTACLVAAAIRAELAPLAPRFVGLSCLANGADQIFARAVLDLGGTLEVVVPAAKYRDGLPAEHHRSYDLLLTEAAKVHRLEFVDSTPESHMEASKHMLGLADELLAVWDGLPARAYGGTADIVAYAQARGVPVRVIWPEGARRGIAAA